MKTTQKPVASSPMTTRSIAWLSCLLTLPAACGGTADELGQGVTEDPSYATNDAAPEASTPELEARGESIAEEPSAPIIEFHVEEDGEVGLSIQSLVADTDAIDAAVKEANGELPLLYEMLTGTPAPEQLQEAYYAAALNDAPDELAPGSETLQDGLEELTSQGELQLGGIVEKAAVSPNFCNFTMGANDEFKMCWPNQTSTPWVQLFKEYVSCNVIALENDLYFEASYKKQTSSSWRTSTSARLYAGWTWNYIGYYAHARRHRRCEVTSNPGQALHHFRAYAQEYIGSVPAPLIWPQP